MPNRGPSHSPQCEEAALAAAVMVVELVVAEMAGAVEESTVAGMHR